MAGRAPALVTDRSSTLADLSRRATARASEADHGGHADVVVAHAERAADVVRRDLRQGGGGERLPPARGSSCSISSAKKHPSTPVSCRPTLLTALKRMCITGAPPQRSDEV